MAIGSEAEIGTSFKSCKDFTIEDWESWWKWMRENWGEQLQSGYAKLIHNKNNRFYTKVDDRDLEIKRLNVLVDELRAEIQRLNGLAKY